MAIFLLTRFKKPYYDEYDAKIVRAKNEAIAREIANQEFGDEGPIWEDPKLVECRAIEHEGIPELILGSFNAG